jgi:hypothetical protein
MIEKTYCKRCLPLGHRDCLAVEGGELCAFCEDKLPCPTTKRQAKAALALQASAPPISGKAKRKRVAAPIPAEAPNPTEEKTMPKKLCACGCGQEVNKRQYKMGHKPKDAAGNKPTSISSLAMDPNFAAGKVVIAEETLDKWFRGLSTSQKVGLFEHEVGA